MFKKKFSKGFAIIYVIIIMIPVLLAAVSVLDLVSTDFMAGNAVEKGNQAKYNAEAGMEYGIRMLENGRYTTDFDYDTAYLFFDEAHSKDNSISYASITIKQSLIGEKYIINSEGFYRGVKNKIEKTIDKNLLLNISRKFTAVNASALSRVDCQIALGSSTIRLPERNRFLILGDRSKTLPNIKLYTNNLGTIQWQDNSDSLFVNSSIYQNRLWNISTQDGDRGIWKQSGTDIEYFISEKGKNYTIDLNSIENSNEELYKGFRDYSGTVSKAGILGGPLRLMLIDGDITIKGIRGDYADNITMSQKYLSNLIIYCKGKLTIDDCTLAGYDNLKKLTDLNISLIAEEMDFKLSGESAAGSNEISYMDGNSGLMITNECEIVDLIKQNTDIYSDWWI